MTASEDLIKSWEEHNFPDEEKIRQMANECDAQQRDAQAMKEVARDAEEIRLKLKAELDAANRSLDWCGEQLKACAPYVKEGESVAECIARNRKDADMLLGELAKERLKCEALEREIGFVRTAYDQRVARHDQEVERAKAISGQRMESLCSKITSVTRAFDYPTPERKHIPWVQVFFPPDDWAARDAFADAIAPKSN